MTPKVKVCGVTDAAFAAAAAQRGVDYLGVIFAGKSPRCVTQAAAQAIAQAARAARSVDEFIKILVCKEKLTDKERRARVDLLF